MRRLALLLCLAAAACGAEVRTEVPIGQWGGRNIDMQVGDTGASVAFKCGASGLLEGHLVMDGRGHFEANGTFLPQLVTGGPRRVRYQGSVSGDQMSLLITEPAGSAIGSFVLVYRAQGHFDVCNF